MLLSRLPGRQRSVILPAMIRTERGGVGPAGKGGYHHGDLRRALLEAALSLLSECGTADLSLRGVARRAGVSYAAPYHHFADKSALLAAVACQGFEGLISALERAARRRRTLESELVAMAEAYVAYATANPTHYRVMFLPEVKASPEADELHAAADRAFGLLVERVARAGGSGPPRRHRELATTVWAALHGLSLLAIDGILEQQVAGPEAYVRRACRAVVGMVIVTSR